MHTDDEPDDLSTSVGLIVVIIILLATDILLYIDKYGGRFLLDQGPIKIHDRVISGLN
jgi:hypothetical protein